MNHDRENLRSYLKQIRKYPELTRERELELAERIQKFGDESAVSEIVEANLRYVTLIARKYVKSGIPLQDLISEGNIGLIAAARRFEPDRGVKFITYAVWWIRQAILFAISTKSRMIRLPPKQESMLHNINKTRSRLMQELGKEPTLQDIANQLEIQVSEVETLIQLGWNSVSLEPTDDDKDSRDTGIDIADDRIVVDDKVIKDEFVDDVELLLTCLPEREKEILRLHFGFEGEPYTLQQIGDRFNLTRERIRQIERRAIEKLRQKAINRNLKDYLSE